MEFAIKKIYYDARMPDQATHPNKKGRSV